MATSNNDGCGMWGIIIGCMILFCMLSALFNPDGSNTSNDSSSKQFYPANSEERFQHEYAKQRIKLEGYSDADATQAADAIMRFQRAQQK